MIEGYAETMLEFLGSGPAYWCAISHRDNHRNWGQFSAADLRVIDFMRTKHGPLVADLSFLVVLHAGFWHWLDPTLALSGLMSSRLIVDGRSRVGPFPHWAQPSLATFLQLARSAVPALTYGAGATAPPAARPPVGGQDPPSRFLFSERPYLKQTPAKPDAGVGRWWSATEVGPRPRAAALGSASIVASGHLLRPGSRHPVAPIRRSKVRSKGRSA